MRNRERGQSLVLFIGVLLALLAILSLVSDGGMYIGHYARLTEDIDAACEAAAMGPIAGLSPAALFAASLQANGEPTEYYEPYTLGADQFPIKGIGWGSHNTLLAGLSGPHEFYLAQFLGFRGGSIAVRTRCEYRTIDLSPFAVQEPWVMRGLQQFPDEAFPIVGQGAAAVTYTGNDYGGAVLLHIWCVDSAGIPDSNCSAPVFFEPLTDSPSSNSLKDLVQETILGTAGMVLPPIGMHLPAVSGVSNNFLVQTADERYDVGDRLIVLVYPGELYKPDPGYGNWDNVEIIYYALAEITEIEPNTLWAKFVGGPYDSPEDIEGYTSRVVPWDWYGTP
jgi:hypothetical protein